MLMAGIKRATLAVALLAVLSGILFGFFRRTDSNRLQNDVRFANDIGWTIEHDRELACEGSVSNATEILWKLHFPSFDWAGSPKPFTGALEQIVERQRRAAIREVIRCLEMKTGEKLGPGPEPWILKFGNETIREQLASMKETSSKRGAEK